jgi:hypothetical protein
MPPPRHFPKGFSILDAGPKGEIASQFFDADLAGQNRRLRREQSELARFSTFAVVCRDLDRVLSEAARISAECMSIPHCAIYRYRPEENDLLIAAGFGWDHQTIGRESSRADGSTPHGRAFTGGNPVICDSLSADAGIVRPRLYIAHGIVATLSVPIISNYQPSGSQNGPLETCPTVCWKSPVPRSLTITTITSNSCPVLPALLRQRLMPRSETLRSGSQPISHRT